MNTLIKIIVTIVISIFLCSCELNRNDVAENENIITTPSHAMEMTQGLNLAVNNPSLR